MPTIALAGYTNVGKSTLLNALTGAEVSVENRLFETLDPTTRGFEYDGRRYLVTDTVGFIRRLPHQLVEGFAATLEETLVADVVLHVADASAPRGAARRDARGGRRGARRDRRRRASRQLVLNKIDRVDEVGRRRLENRFPDAPQVSAATGEGLEQLKRADRRAASRAAARPCGCCSPTRRAAGSRSSTRSARRSTAREDTPEGVLVVARLPRHELRRFAPYLIADAPHGGRAAGDGLIELPIRRLRDDAVLPARAYAGDAGLDLAACERVELAPGRARARPDRARGRDPGGLRRLRAAALGARRQARDHDREHARPRRLRLPRRAARQPAQHRPRASRSSSSRGCGSRSSSSSRSPRSSSSRSSELPDPSAACAASDPRRRDERRASASRRCCAGRTGCCSAARRSRARSTGCCRAEASRRARRSTQALRRELGEELGISRRPRLRRADRGRRVDRARLDARRPARRAHRLRRRPLRTAHSTTSSRTTRRCADCASSRLDELEDIVVHPPMKRFVAALAPRRPGCLPRLALDPLSGCRSARRSSARATSTS